MRGPRLVAPGWIPRSEKAGAHPPRRTVPSPAKRCLGEGFRARKLVGSRSEDPSLRLGRECTRLQKRQTVKRASGTKIQTVPPDLDRRRRTSASPNSADSVSAGVSPRPVSIWAGLWAGPGRGRNGLLQAWKAHFLNPGTHCRIPRQVHV